MGWTGVVEGAFIRLAPTALLQVGRLQGASDWGWSVQWFDGREARGVAPTHHAAQAAAERALVARR